MKWCRTISPGARLLQVQRGHAVAAANAKPPEAADRQHEQATFERGVAEGEKRLSAQLLRQRAELLELQNGVLKSLQDAAVQVVQQSEAALVQLALEVAQKLVGDLPLSQEMVEAAIRSTLAQAEEATEFDIYLNGQDLALLQQCNSPVLLPGPSQKTMRFHASEEVTRGGCLVQTRFGTLDARRETKLALIQKSLEA